MNKQFNLERKKNTRAKTNYLLLLTISQNLHIMHWDKHLLHSSHFSKEKVNLIKCKSIDVELDRSQTSRTYLEVLPVVYTGLALGQCNQSICTGPRTIVGPHLLLFFLLLPFTIYFRKANYY